MLNDIGNYINGFEEKDEFIEQSYLKEVNEKATKDLSEVGEKIAQELIERFDYLEQEGIIVYLLTQILAHRKNELDLLEKQTTQTARAYDWMNNLLKKKGVK